MKNKREIQYRHSAIFFAIAVAGLAATLLGLAIYNLVF